MDEKMMPAKQDRLIRGKKRKKSRKKIVLAGSMVLAAAVMGTVVLLLQRKQNAEREAAVQIQATAGQQIIYAKLHAVNGNEITYNVVREMESADGSAPNQQENSAGKTNTVSGVADIGRGRPAMSDGGGQIGDRPEMPAGKSETMERTGMPEGKSEITERTGMPAGKSETTERTEMPEGKSETTERTGTPEGKSETTERTGMPAGDNQTTERTENPDTDSRTNEASGTTAGNNETSGTGGKEEIVTTLIPVGTEVITKLGTVTTFSRLAAGDTVALVIEEVDGEPVIDAVYIIG